MSRYTWAQVIGDEMLAKIMAGSHVVYHEVLNRAIQHVYLGDICSKCGDIVWAQNVNQKPKEALARAIKV